MAMTLVLETSSLSLESLNSFVSRVSRLFPNSHQASGLGWTGLGWAEARLARCGNWLVWQARKTSYTIHILIESNTGGNCIAFLVYLCVLFGSWFRVELSGVRACLVPIRYASRVAS